MNIFPAQIEEIIKFTDGASSEYQVMIDHLEGKDIMTVFFETDASVKIVNRSSATWSRSSRQVGHDAER